MPDNSRIKKLNALKPKIYFNHIFQTNYISKSQNVSKNKGFIIAYAL